MNHFMMGMLAIAATSFVSCSNEDGTDNTPRQNVDNFYMNLQVVGNNSTRTTGTPTEDGTAEESKITSGTIWLVDASGAVKFSKHITADEWNASDNTVNNPIKVAVTQVEENKPYQVYFLANKEGGLTTSPTTQTFTSEKGGIDYAKDNAFVMFNQNDKAVKANNYTVTFTKDNKDESNPAKPTSEIKLDRLTARIDVPTTVTTITTDPVKTDRTVNIEAITGLTFEGYATSNLANKSNVEQLWDANWTTLQVPDGLTYYWDKASYGTAKKAENLINFQKENKLYLFEQTTTNEDDATSIYLQYTATASTTANKDFTDGTFYRYDKRVFTSIQDIITYAGAANPFGDKTAAQVVAEIKDATSTDTDVKCTTDEAKLKAFRDEYKIEVFVAGKVYYKYAIQDPTHSNYTILRNSIYRIEIKNIYDLGSDTPNGEDEKVKPVYYLNVKVTVNPWILKTIGVDLE